MTYVRLWDKKAWRHKAYNCNIWRRVNHYCWQGHWHGSRRSRSGPRRKQ